MGGPKKKQKKGSGKLQHTPLAIRAQSLPTAYEARACSLAWHSAATPFLPPQAMERCAIRIHTPCPACPPTKPSISPFSACYVSCLPRSIDRSIAQHFHLHPFCTLQRNPYRSKTLACTGKKIWNAVSCALSGSTVAIPQSQIWSLSLAASECLSLSLSFSELSLCVLLSRARGFSESRSWFETLEETLKEQRFFVTSIPRRCCCCCFFFFFFFSLSLSLSLIILSVRLIFWNTKTIDCVLSSFVCMSSSIRSEKVSCPPLL